MYIIHRFDYGTSIEETMEALDSLVKAGKVRALGASAMYGYQFYNMQLAAERNGWTPFSSMQNHYSLLYREYKTLHDYFGRGENDVMKRLRALRSRLTQERTATE